MELHVLFGNNVRHFRQLRGWSQEELAEATGLHRTYISGIETGRRNPSLLIVSKIAAVLDVPPEQLLERH